MAPKTHRHPFTKKLARGITRVNSDIYRALKLLIAAEVT